MKKKYLKRYISLTLACAIGLSLVAAVPTVTFAAENSARIQTAAVVQNTINRNVLRKSKKKKIRNASRIPVLAYHRILSDNVKRTPAYKNDRFGVFHCLSIKNKSFILF